MVTNHGVHEWQITAGLPDTGGQNVYVNELSAAFAKLGFRVTTANRGGYPHPADDSADSSARTGVRTRGDAERIVYLEDSSDEFIRKEDMFSRVEELAHDLARRVGDDRDSLVAIISHYWDGARVADLARTELGLEDVPHIWIPHSLGRLKKRNTDASSWDELRIPERIEAETQLLARLDAVVHTSRAMEESLRDDYGYEGSIFVPPGVDTDRFDPEKVRNDRRGIELLGELLGRDAAQITDAPVVTEISRTAPTKRKDVLIRAFARARERFPSALLAVTIDSTEEKLYAELTGLIEELSLTDSVAVLGSVWEYVPSLYGLSAVYCTPSIMEGFGMSIQEAAACRVAAVACDRVPFAAEYLLGDQPKRETLDDGSTIAIGEGAIVVPPDEVEATAEALVRLLEDDALRDRMAERAYRITVPAFTWRNAAKQLLTKAGVSVPGAGES